MSAEAGILPVIAAVVGVGVAAEVLASYLRIPSIPFLLLAGIALGPEGVGVLSEATFAGGALSAIVGVSVAVIVFEGAFGLDVAAVRRTGSVTLRLVSVGAVVTLVGTALVVHLALGASWAAAALVGSLLVATGPTVIGPVLDAADVGERVGTVLETEGIVNDVTAAIAAVIAFEVLTLDRGLAAAATAFVGRFAVGTAVGVLLAGVVWALFRYAEHAPENAPQDARLLVVAGAVVAYGGAELIVGEAGIVAAATAGVLLGNVGLPYEEHVAEFKDDVTRLVLAFVFITLASLVEFADLLALGVGGLVVVVAVLAVVRPLAVAVSTLGSGLSRRERAFLSFVAPRGIVPAAVATLFALRLEASRPAVATTLTGTVFLVIVATVVVEGGTARHVAEWLGIDRGRTVVVGGGTLGLALARRYREGGSRVDVVESTPVATERARNAGFTVHAGDGTDPDVLLGAGIADATQVVAATDDDEVNLEVASLAVQRFGVPTVVARLNDPDNGGRFDALGVRTFSGPTLRLWAIETLFDQPLPDWLSAFARGGDVREIEVGPPVAGRTVRAVEADLPHRVLIVALARDGETRFPGSETRLEAGDRISLLGARGAMPETVARFLDGR
ncbi:MAG: cation:proton antiporter [Haloquadratum sp.]